MNLDVDGEVQSRREVLPNLNSYGYLPRQAPP
jgi:hypothetical protein